MTQNQSACWNEIVDRTYYMDYAMITGWRVVVAVVAVRVVLLAIEVVDAALVVSLVDVGGRVVALVVTTS